ncbi:hypothetical protein ALC53_04634 [Atta colombica]|uniref:Uncharacterized protein n=1 Tax=Atta colombica TaxID=520822 RepID=A0A195BJM5_9HYME|nr:hypothetical protein ALC53_04634 [Atta colombica]
MLLHSRPCICTTLKDDAALLIPAGRGTNTVLQDNKYTTSSVYLAIAPQANEGGRKAHCYFHGSSLILPVPSWDTPPILDPTNRNRVSNPSRSRARARSLARYSSGGEGKTFPCRSRLSSSVPVRFCSLGM